MWASVVHLGPKPSSPGARPATPTPSAIVSGVGATARVPSSPGVVLDAFTRLEGAASVTPAPLDVATRSARAQQAAETLFTAMHGGVWGWGTDERKLFASLGSVPAEDLPRVRAHYKAHYGRSLDQDVRGELSGADKARASALLLGQAEQADAVTLRQALRGLRKDRGTVLQILERAAHTKRSGALAEAYREHAGHSLSSRLEQTFSGPARARAQALLRGDTAAADTHLVAELLAGKPGKIQDGVLLGVLRRGGAELAATYAQQYGAELSDTLSAQLPSLQAAQARAALEGDDTTLRAVGLRRVLTGDTRFDVVDALDALLAGTSTAERQAIRAQYTQLYSAPLDGSTLSADRARALGELLDTGRLTLATELHAARKDPARVLALLGESTPAARAEAAQRYTAQHGTTLEHALTHGADGLDRLRIQHALAGPPADLEQAVGRLSALREQLRSGPWNSTSRVLMDWILLSKKGSRLDDTIARAENALAEARADGVITPEEHAQVVALIDYGARDLDSYRDAVHRVARVTTGVAGTLAASTTLALTAGAGTPLALQVAAASLAGGTASAATAAVTGGRLYTQARLRQEFGLGAINGATTVLGRAAVGALSGPLTDLIADRVFGSTLNPGTSAVQDALTRRLAADFAINAYDPLRVAYGLTTGAVRGAVSMSTARATLTALDGDTWQDGARRGLGKLVAGALAGAKEGAVNGSLAALVSLAISGVEYTTTLPEAEARKLLTPLTVDTPSGPHEVVVVGQLDPSRLAALRTSLQQLSDVTGGKGVAGLDQVHVFELGERTTGMCLGPNGFALAPELALTKLTHTAWHESGHRLHTQLANLVATLTGDHPFGQPPYVSDYAGKNLYEDLACTHELLIKNLVQHGTLTLDPAHAALAPKVAWLVDHMYPELR